MSLVPLPSNVDPAQVLVGELIEGAPREVKVIEGAAATAVNNSSSNAIRPVCEFGVTQGQRVQCLGGQKSRRHRSLGGTDVQNAVRVLPQMGFRFGFCVAPLKRPPT